MHGTTGEATSSTARDRWWNILTYSASSLFLVAGGWWWGAIVESSQDPCDGRPHCDAVGFIALVLPVTVVFSVVLFGVLVAMRPIRWKHRLGFSTLAALGFFGTYRGAGIPIALAIAAVVGAIQLIPRQRLFNWGA